MEVNKEKNQYILQFFFDKGENACQAAEIVNGVDGADTHVSSLRISKEQKIDHKTVFSHLSKVEFKKKLAVCVPHQKTRWIEFPSAKPWPNGMKSTHFLIEWRLEMRNRSHTTILSENDRAQSVVMEFKRWPNPD
ncbi:hypothetical protein TNCV_4330701 [Trichonephila clavipes]|nr:hypothetical protein TNCV_4330701 [Trichonephila clavipes]